MNRRYRKTVIAGNWKMNMTATETKKFAEDLKKIMPRAKWCDTLICVPACNIQTAAKAFKDLRISVGAENVYFEEKGAYTGEDLRVLCVCVSKFEEADLYGVVHELDPNAFFITQEGVTIHGNFIRKLS
mgnify:CR=1 FL=1